MNTTRRSMLKGVALGSGGLVLTPLISQLSAQAAGTTTIPQRFVFVIKGSGLTPGAIVPTNLVNDLVVQKKSYIAGEGYNSGIQLKENDRLKNISLKDATFDKSMKALKPFQDRVMILQGLSGNMVTGGHSSFHGAMSCVKHGMAETIDHELSRIYPAVFPHLRLSAYSRQADAAICYPKISAASISKDLPYYASPATAFQSLYSSVADGESRKMFKAKGQLFNYLIDDIRNLRKGIAGAEKDKLERHIEAIEALEKQRVGLEAMPEQIKKGMPELTAKYASVEVEDRYESHCNIAAGALISGLTNVVTIRADTIGSSYTKVGFAYGGVHGIGHGNTPEGTESPDEARAMIVGFHLQKIADMAAKLNAVPEGDGTMLDNTTFIYFSDVGDKHHASNREWPYIVLGNMGGKLKSAGRYIQYPSKGQPGHHTIANWWLSLLHAAGNPRNDFGVKDKAEFIPIADQRGPLKELVS